MTSEEDLAQHPADTEWHRWAPIGQTLEDAPIEVLAGLGPVLQRLSEATKAIPAVARCHFSRWNDGSAHLHLWAYARPAGMMQGRGAILPYWEQAMPAMPEAMMNEHIDIVANALAAGGERPSRTVEPVSDARGILFPWTMRRVGRAVLRRGRRCTFTTQRSFVPGSNGTTPPRQSCGWKCARRTSRTGA